MLAGFGSAGVTCGAMGAVCDTVGAACEPPGAGCVVPGVGLTAGTGITLTLPTRMPASCKAKVALPSGCPVRFGMIKAAGSPALVTSRLILGAATPFAFAGGFCETTWSGAVFGGEFG